MILKNLEKALKKLLQVFLAEYREYQVEGVEIKGTPHIITWAWGKKRRIEAMKSGSLAKLPRDILDRFDESRTPGPGSDDIRELRRRLKSSSS
jgi:hypothetical protein